MSWATPRPGAYTPKTPQASFTSGPLPRCSRPGSVRRTGRRRPPWAPRCVHLYRPHRPRPVRRARRVTWSRRRDRSAHPLHLLGRHRRPGPGRRAGGPGRGAGRSPSPTTTPWPAWPRPAGGRPSWASSWCPGCEVSCVLPRHERPRARLLRRRRRGAAPRRAGPPAQRPGGPEPGHGRPGWPSSGIAVTYDELVAEAAGEESAGPAPRGRRPGAQGRGRLGPRRLRPLAGPGPPGLRAQGPDHPDGGGRPGPGLGRGGGAGPPAHAWASSRDDLESAVAELAEAGFSGIEAVYGRYSPAERAAPERAGARARPGGHRRVGLPRRRSSPTCRSAPGAATCKVPDAVLDRLARSAARTEPGPAQRRFAQGLRPGRRRPRRPGRGHGHVDAGRPPPGGSPPDRPSTVAGTPAAVARASTSAGWSVATTMREGSSQNSSAVTGDPAQGASPGPAAHRHLGQGHPEPAGRDVVGTPRGARPRRPPSRPPAWPPGPAGAGGRPGRAEASVTAAPAPALHCPAAGGQGVGAGRVAAERPRPEQHHARRRRPSRCRAAWRPGHRPGPGCRCTGVGSMSAPPLSL